MWSFTVDPTETFMQGETWGAYAVEGVGFYHKVSNLASHRSQEDTAIRTTWHLRIAYVANAIIDHYTSNAVGFNAGLGLTYKFSKFSNERFYGEVRYVFVDNSHRPGVNGHEYLQLRHTGKSRRMTSPPTATGRVTSRSSLVSDSNQI